MLLAYTIENKINTKITNMQSKTHKREPRTERPANIIYKPIVNVFQDMKQDFNNFVSIT